MPQTSHYHPFSQDFYLEKAWGEGEDTFFEGWLSTPTKDPEKHIVEPEAFIPAMESYFARRAPLSYTHATKKLPAGHLQKAAVIRDGQVVKTVDHPSDKHEFTMLPASGNGVWVRGVVNDPDVALSLQKGNTGGLSYIANANKLEHLSDGAIRVTGIDWWMESTVAPYPVNPEAVLQLAKSFGLEPETPQTEDFTTMPNLDEMLEAALNRIAEKDAAKKAEEARLQKAQEEQVTPDKLAETLVAFEQRLMEKITPAVETTLKKAIETTRGEGVGRKQEAQAKPEISKEESPVKYLLQKAKKGEEYTAEDDLLVGALSAWALTAGMTDGSEDK